MKVNMILNNIVEKKGQEFVPHKSKLLSVLPYRNRIESYLKQFLKEQTFYRGEVTGFTVEMDGKKQFLGYDDCFTLIQNKSQDPLDISIEPVIDHQQDSLDTVIAQFIKGTAYSKDKRDSLESLASTSGTTYQEGEFEDSIVIDETTRVIQNDSFGEGYLTEEVIQSINRNLQNDKRNREIPEYPGDYRHSITNFGVKPDKIPEAMQAFIKTYNSTLNSIKPIVKQEKGADEKIKDVLTKAANIHTQLVAIHPFHNCNGKTARVLMNLLLNKAALPLAPINHWSASYQYYTGQHKTNHEAQSLERLILEAMIYDGVKLQNNMSANLSEINLNTTSISSNQNSTMDDSPHSIYSMSASTDNFVKNTQPMEKSIDTVTMGTSGTMGISNQKSVDSMEISSETEGLQGENISSINQSNILIDSNAMATCNSLKDQLQKEKIKEDANEMIHSPSNDPS